MDFFSNFLKRPKKSPSSKGNIHVITNPKECNIVLKTDKFSEQEKQEIIQLVRNCLKINLDTTQITLNIIEQTNKLYPISIIEKDDGLEIII